MIYIYSFVFGLLLGGVGILGGLIGISEFFNSITRSSSGDPQQIISIIIYFLSLFLIWLALSLLLKRMLQLEKKKYLTVFLTVLLGMSITASLFMYILTHLSFGGF